MLTHYFDPEGGAAATPGVIARSLHHRGHSVDVVTGYPNYPEGTIFDGYSFKLFYHEKIDGIDVHRLPMYPSHDARAVHRIANFMSFGLSSLAGAPRLLRPVDVQFVYFSPATTTLGALPLALSKKVPMVMLIQDMWPDSVTSSGFLPDRTTRLVNGILNPFCNFLYKTAASIAVTSPSMADLLIERGVDATKIHFVPNWSDESAFHPTERNQALREELGITGRFTMMYAGNLGDMQNLDTAIEAAELLRHRPDIQFVFVGSGIKESHLRDMATSRGLTNIVFVPPQPFDRMSEIIALADCQLVSLRDSRIMRSTLPSKLQANLAAGSPIIGAVAGDAASVIDAAGCGMVATPGNAESLAHAIEKMATLDPVELGALAQNARAYYENTFSEQVACDRLVDVLTQAVV